MCTLVQTEKCAGCTLKRFWFHLASVGRDHVACDRFRLPPPPPTPATEPALPVTDSTPTPWPSKEGSMRSPLCSPPDQANATTLSSVGESIPKAAAALKHIERRKELPIGSVASFVPREIITVLRRVGAPPASSQGSPIPLASDTVVPEEIDETVTAPPSHEDTLCHWERGKKGRAETGISRRFSTAFWVPFGIVFGVPASPSKKRMENEGLWRSSTVHFNSFGANVGHVGNIFAYRCFLFAVPMLCVCRAAPLKTRFRSQDIITAFPVTSWEPPRRHLGHFVSL